MNGASMLARYANGGTEVTIYADGTKVRRIIDPNVAPPLPEQMDLKITDWCDAGCAWCHEQSTRKGRHADLERTLDLLSPLPAGAEIAIGGGDALSHPDFESFVRALSGRGIVPSVTVNGRHFERHRNTLERLTGDGALYGVGFSYFDRLPDWDYEHLVVHMIAGVNDPETLLGADRQHKVLVLGYKRHGRGQALFRVRPAPIEANLSLWYRLLPFVAQQHHLSFDNLAIGQLRPQRLFRNPADYDRRYMGAEGQYSMYIDAVSWTYGLSSYGDERLSCTTLGAMFPVVRQMGAATTATNALPKTTGVWP